MVSTAMQVVAVKIEIQNIVLSNLYMWTKCSGDIILIAVITRSAAMVDMGMNLKNGRKIKLKRSMLIALITPDILDVAFVLIFSAVRASAAVAVAS